MPHVTVGQARITYEVIHSGRRTTIAIEISPDRRIVVRAPLRASEALLAQVVREKAQWVLRHLERPQCSPTPARQFTTGERLLFLGESYNLEVLANGARRDTRVDLTGHALRVVTCAITDGALLSLAVRESLEYWYRQRAREVLGQRVVALSTIAGVMPSLVRIKDQRRRWGSCSSVGSVNLNWRIVMAPLDIVDYVVVHELCHLRELNHSRGFWALVASVLPDYRVRREWLRHHGAFLTL